VDKKRTAFLTILTALTFTWISFTTIAEAKNMEKSQSLDARQQAIVPIAAFTANGDLAKLKPALVEGLDAGLTVNEIKDILVQMYAYAGFPRSLNGIHAFMALLEERQARGIEDEVGKDAGPVPEDFNRDAYGAKVRAKLAGQKEIPPPRRLSSVHARHRHVPQRTSFRRHLRPRRPYPSGKGAGHHRCPGRHAGHGGTVAFPFGCHNEYRMDRSPIEGFYLRARCKGRERCRRKDP
jgi:alkylhydroperoxidase/carboxymuconolactone decarboxylase family protein YurZ